ncbi:MAG: hypothetical protein AAFW95_00580 [Cyanobacteria bacterium J06638_6]
MLPTLSHLPSPIVPTLSVETPPLALLCPGNDDAGASGASWGYVSTRKRRDDEEECLNQGTVAPLAFPDIEISVSRLLGL